eukprot:TRINITY_DN2735_c0_g1_i2.p1 TRINITY_DN2735_c0_g1~~TRINITY_DN2735_c0_g1_i2.p1  ORF type:complete len:229 (+),score=70.70 TRINITY_DN2735_c0_g1_i2:210-896(+)
MADSDIPQYGAPIAADSSSKDFPGPEHVCTPDENNGVEYALSYMRLTGGYGAVLLIVGIVAIVFPLTFSYAITLSMGLILLVVSAVSFITSCLMLPTSGSAAFLFLGLLHGVAALFLLFDVSGGIILITIVLATWLILKGAGKMYLAYVTEHHKEMRIPFIISGIFSVVLGIFVIIIMNRNTEELLGILLGSDLVATGLAAITIAVIGQALEKRQSPVSLPLLSEQQP